MNKKVNKRIVETDTSTAMLMLAPFKDGNQIYFRNTQQDKKVDQKTINQIKKKVEQQVKQQQN